MTEVLKQFVKTYGPKLESFLVAGVIFALNAVLLALTGDKPNVDVLALVNIFAVAFLNFATSYARNMVTQEVQASADKAIKEVTQPEAGKTNF